MTQHTFQFSKESAYLQRSVMRDLLKHAVDPEIISLAGGLPASDLLPTEQFRECLNDVIARDGGHTLQYSPQYDPLREWIAGYMKQRGVDCTLDNIYITNGNQQGLTILSRLFLDTGDPAVTEQVVFTGVKQITSGRGADTRTIPTDLKTGADMDALEAVFRLEPRPRLAVLIPDFHNPLGVSISAEKRKRAAELAVEYHVPLIEDDPYSPLRFKGDVLKPIKSYDEAGYVFYLGSFSKMLAPGLRLGWMVVPSELMAKITVMREAIDLESSTLYERSVALFLQRGYLEPHLKQLNTENARRCETLMQSLQAHFGEIATWTQPEGGLFAWMTLPDHVDTWELLQEAIANHVVYIPGGAFTVGEGLNNTMRLNFSSVTPDAIKQGVARLAQVVKKKI